MGTIEFHHYFKNFLLHWLLISFLKQNIANNKKKTQANNKLAILKLLPAK